MKPYIKMLLDGGVNISFRSCSISFNRAFIGPEGYVIPYEGLYRDIYEKTDGKVSEMYRVDINDPTHYVQCNTISECNDALITFSHRGKKTYQYLENCSDTTMSEIADRFNQKAGDTIISKDIFSDSSKCFTKYCLVVATVYKAKNAWIIVSTESPGRTGVYFNIIAPDMRRAIEIKRYIFILMGNDIPQYTSRVKRYIDHYKCSIFNNSEEGNRLRHKYLKLIKDAYRKFDFTELFKYIDDECEWDGGSTKNEVIEKLIKGAAVMKKNNYTHKCTIVQVDNPFSRHGSNTNSNESGEKQHNDIFYDQGELCMIDETPRQTLFFRMKLSASGKIRSFYATLPSGSYHVTEDKKAGEGVVSEISKET